jgi:CBS domain-containing protein
MKVQELMTKDVSCCEPGTNAATAAELMWNRNCGALPVVENGGRLAGIVTDRDLFIALGTRNRLPSDLAVGEIMNQDVASCAPGDDIKVALKTMAERGLQRLAVVDKNDSLQGILSVGDLLRHGEGDGLSRDALLKTLQAIDSQHLRRPQPQRSESPKKAIA